ncbi:MAG: type II and III secretion system protein [Blastochloris sp.]|nr:type II and III secretion system protein [Blastochloris sp.]
MKTTLKATALALLVLGCHELYADIEVDAKLIETSPDVSVTTDLAALSQVKGVEIVSAPRVAMQPGTKAKIEVTREFTIEGQKPIPVGIELEITADHTPDGLKFDATYKLTEFEGFINYGVDNPEGKKRPVFQTVTVPFQGIAEDSKSILIEVGSKNDKSKKRFIHLTIKNV